MDLGRICLTLANGICRASLLAYPRAFRRQFGEEMSQVFRTQARDTLERGGVAGLAKLLLSSAVDLAKSASAERWHALDKTVVALLHIAIGGGVFATYVDFRNNEVQACVLVLVVVTTSLSLIKPRFAFLWALAVGMWVPIGHVFGPRFGLISRYPVHPNNWASAVAFIPALVGAGFGALVRYGTFPPATDQDRGCPPQW